MSICALCQADKRLATSHVIPSFVFKWLKETSATGFIRDVRHGNRRAQDGFKTPLLCHSCGGILSRIENSFKVGIFQEFTERHIDLSGRIVEGGSLPYEEWLNQFIISVVWRSFKSHFFRGYRGDIPKELLDKISALLEKWRRYLLGESDKHGNVANYLLFMRNFYEGSGELPPETSPYILFST